LVPLGSLWLTNTSVIRHDGQQKPTEIHEQKKAHPKMCLYFVLKQSAYKGITSSPKCKELRQLPDAET
jgi:hypothetical protein